MRPSNRMTGFTLVEILVVISIIGILVSLAVPAVMEAKRTAARAECASKIRQLASATIQYEVSHGQMPGYLQRFGTFAGGVDPSDAQNYGGNVPRHIKVAGWPVAVMSKLDNQPAYERWSMDRYPVIADSSGSQSVTPEGYSPYAAINNPAFICPSATGGLANMGINHYVANTGMHVASLPMTYTRPGSSPITVDFAKTQSVANGIFNNQYAGFDPLAPNKLVPTGKPFRFDDCKDGATQTMLLSENQQAQPTYRTRMTNDTSHLTTIMTVQGRETTVYPVSSRYVQGAVWHFEDSEGFAAAPPVATVHKINGGDIYNIVMTTANAADVARPSSLHVGGANMAMVDGSVQFVTETIDYRLYQSLMTPSGRSSDVPQNEFLPLDGI